MKYSAAEVNERFPENFRGDKFNYDSPSEHLPSRKKIRGMKRKTITADNGVKLDVVERVFWSLATQ